MTKPIQISIPTPCHENWDAMTPADKGRFCTSCQKNVIDFTKSSDREIAESIKHGNICGRFREDQLDRNLVIPKKKSTIWAAASAAVISLISSGNSKTYSQESPGKEITQNSTNKKENPPVLPEPFTITWNVKDDDKKLLEGAKISIIGSDKKTVSDANGNFSLTVNPGDIIKIKYKGKRTREITIHNKDYANMAYVILYTRKEEKRIVKGSPRYF